MPEPIAETTEPMMDSAYYPMKSKRKGLNFVKQFVRRNG